MKTKLYLCGPITGMPNHNRDIMNKAIDRVREAVYRPEIIHNVSTTQLSIARHYGGIKVNGVYYCYDPKSDTLIRDDVLKAKLAEAKKTAAAEKKKQQDAQQVFTELGESE